MTFSYYCGERKEITMEVRFEEISVNTWKINEVSENPVVFQFSYEDGVYGFMVGKTFHPFGGEVAPTGD